MPPRGPTLPAAQSTHLAITAQARLWQSPGSRQTLDSAAGRYACMRLGTHRAVAAGDPRGLSLPLCSLVPAALTPGTFVSSVARGLARARLRASTPAAVPAGSAAEGVA